MGERLRILWTKLNTGYWLIPTVMTIGAVSTSYLAVLLDVRFSDGYLDSWWLGYTGGADGARAVLSAVASSMINVAGVVFSITVVILSLATQQFGTYILRSFMRDRGNQTVLGVHHLAHSIKSSSLVAQSGHDFVMAIDRLFPQDVTEPSSFMRHMLRIEHHFRDIDDQFFQDKFKHAFAAATRI
jgi:uncharacterized membrane protein